LGLSYEAVRALPRDVYAIAVDELSKQPDPE
jgi:hypothetical protein